MAGPTVGILLKEKLNESVKEEILMFIHSVSNEVCDTDFRVNDRPLGYIFGPEFPEQIEYYSGVRGTMLDWAPKDIIVLYAMCNQEIDHISLGEVTLGITKIVDASIAFCDVLSSYTSDSEILKSSGVVEYGQESIISPQLFERWLKHQDFRMVK